MSDTLVTERRMTPTERLHEVTMAAMGRRPAAPESAVTISRNAKGIAQFEVTVRHEDVVFAHDMALLYFDALNQRYPYEALSAPVTAQESRDAE
jgi:hypothetical protein